MNIKKKKILSHNKLCQTFYNPNANRAELAACGNKIIARMYNNDKTITDLNDLIFVNFKKSPSRSSFKLENLPPTEGAGKQLSFRTFQQLQQWLGNYGDGKKLKTALSLSTQNIR